ncbi:MAG TPA: hypothetical protein VKL21_08085 [Candidatus Methanoperedens sp.]|nr:hypothetical protein [Candidatus Methanoperedens sp.]
MYKTMIGILHGETQKIIKICEDIAAKDNSFAYYIIRPTVKEIKYKFENVLVLLSDSEKEAKSRGGWFIHRCENAKIPDYFWIKKA